MKENSKACLSAEDALRRLEGLLGLARKAGRIILGTELICDAVRRRRVRQVFITANASDNTKKRLTNCCEYYGVGYAALPITTEALARVSGKTGAVAAAGITDEGFAGAMTELIKQNRECGTAGAKSAGGAVNGTESEIQDQ